MANNFGNDSKMKAIATGFGVAGITAAGTMAAHGLGLTRGLGTRVRAMPGTIRGGISSLARGIPTKPGIASGIGKMGSFLGTRSLMFGGILGGAAFATDILTSISRSMTEKPMVHRSFSPRAGKAGQYYSLGEMPTSGVRFAGRYRRGF